MPNDLLLTEKTGRKLYFTPVLNKGKGANNTDLFRRKDASSWVTSCL